MLKAVRRFYCDRRLAEPKLRIPISTPPSNLDMSQLYTRPARIRDPDNNFVCRFIWPFDNKAGGINMRATSSPTEDGPSEVGRRRQCANSRDPPRPPVSTHVSSLEELGVLVDVADHFANC